MLEVGLTLFKGSRLIAASTSTSSSTAVAKTVEVEESQHGNQEHGERQEREESTVYAKAMA